MGSVRTSKDTTAANKPAITHTIAVGPTGKPMNVKSARLTIRSDEAARRVMADTDGTLRRAKQIAERNRLV